MIEFVSTAPQQLLAEAVARYEEKSGETLAPGSEQYLFLAQEVQLNVAVRELINDSANKNLLRYMSGELLDAYGEQFGVHRLPAKCATVKMEFRLMLPLPFDVPVPAGVRVTPDGQINFAVLEDAVIAKGETSAQAEAVASAVGSAYNGFLPGQIKSIVDVNMVSNVSSVTNTTASAGGADREDDDSYRERIRLSWEGISTCGSKEGYEYWARTAPGNIVAVEAVSNADSEITIYVLLRDAAQPSQALLDEVTLAVSAKTRRPLTDHVMVQAAVAKAYDIILTYYIDRYNATEEAKIKTAVETAVSNFASAQKQQLGGNLNPDSLRREILRAGGYRIDISSPVYMELMPQEVAIAGNVTVNYGGLL